MRAKCACKPAGPAARASTQPESFCYACGSTDIAWKPSTGEGEIYSFIEVHQLYNAAFKDHLPYVVAIVQLDDGPRILGAMLGLRRGARDWRARAASDQAGRRRTRCPHL